MVAVPNRYFIGSTIIDIETYASPVRIHKKLWITMIWGIHTSTLQSLYCMVLIMVSFLVKFATNEVNKSPILEHFSENIGKREELNSSKNFSIVKMVKTYDFIKLMLSVLAAFMISVQWWRIIYSIFLSFAFNNHLTMQSFCYSSLHAFLSHSDRIHSSCYYFSLFKEKKIFPAHHLFPDPHVVSLRLAFSVAFNSVSNYIYFYLPNIIIPHLYFYLNCVGTNRR